MFGIRRRRIERIQKKADDLQHLVGLKARAVEAEVKVKILEYKIIRERNVRMVLKIVGMLIPIVGSFLPDAFDWVGRPAWLVLSPEDPDIEVIMDTARDLGWQEIAEEASLISEAKQILAQISTTIQKTIVDLSEAQITLIEINVDELLIKFRA